jgi:hypothetical protein
MNARNKLNTIFVGGSVVVAGGLGIYTGSWAIFGLSLALLLAGNLVARNIRPK